MWSVQRRKQSVGDSLIMQNRQINKAYLHYTEMMTILGSQNIMPKEVFFKMIQIMFQDKDQDNSNKNVPTKVTAVVGVVKVSGGGTFTLLVDGNDNIMSMGSNNYGQLGLGDTKARNTPTLLTGI